MANYKVTFKNSVLKDLKLVPKSDIQEILKKIDSIAENPYMIGAIKLSGNDFYRVRQGMYRIVYEIRDNELIVNVIRIGHRSSVYKNT
jgi:mRNA interferase RelE/StbE